MSDVELIAGRVYVIKSSSGLVRAKFISEVIRTRYTSQHALRKSPERKHYLFENIATGRTIEIKSKLKIRSIVP